MAEGVRKRHSKGCAATNGGRCDCKAGYEAWVFSRREQKKVRKTFRRASEAKMWRAEAKRAMTLGTLQAPGARTLYEAWATWIAGAKAGVVRNRSGDVFKPSALRSYEGAMESRVLPELGGVRLTELSRPQLQDFVDSLVTQGLSPSAIQTTTLPLRAIFRRAIARGELVISPCDGLELPAVRGRRERFASPAEAATLIAEAPERDQPVWATAMYGGLRLGELRALRVEDVDLANGVIRVERGWDAVEGEIGLKSQAGRRKVPIAPILHTFLVDHLTRSGREGAELIFGRTPSDPFSASRLQGRADEAWEAVNERERELAESEEREPHLLKRITPHECRHTFASLMIAANVNAKALATFMGHAKVSITLDRYGHLMPGSEAEAAELLHAYLAKRQ